mmetsp:Transcript_15964/g.37680  ORF Transcript_15964/g.37680 Transcript_15964/m.37680 type:complete len:697 (-) Transcript_15964:306-2396(-)
MFKKFIQPVVHRSESAPPESTGSSPTKGGRSPADPARNEPALQKTYDPVSQKWKESMVVVRMEAKPFAEGAMRRAYRMWDVTEEGSQPIALVAKIAKKEDESVARYIEDCEMQMVAKLWAKKFNDKKVPKKVDFLSAYIIQLISRPGKPVCAVEHYVEGDYVRYNNNWDWSDDKRNTPQAFSHFTYEMSNHELLVCDLQGVGDLWTDPQVHTKDGRLYGRGNKSLQGFARFFSAHSCNNICRYLRLPMVGGSKRPKPFYMGTPPPTWSLDEAGSQDRRGTLEFHLGADASIVESIMEKTTPPSGSVEHTRSQDDAAVLEDVCNPVDHEQHKRDMMAVGQGEAKRDTERSEGGTEVTMSRAVAQDVVMSVVEADVMSPVLSKVLADVEGNTKPGGHGACPPTPKRQVTSPKQLLAAQWGSPRDSGGEDRRGSAGSGDGTRNRCLSARGRTDSLFGLVFDWEGDSGTAKPESPKAADSRSRLDSLFDDDCFTQVQVVEILPPEPKPRPQPALKSSMKQPSGADSRVHTQAPEQSPAVSPYPRPKSLEASAATAMPMRPKSNADGTNVSRAASAGATPNKGPPRTGGFVLGPLVGVGMRVEGSPQGGYLVTALTPGGPAARSDSVKPGDHLVQIDDCDVRNIHLDLVKKLILGPEGSVVSMKYQTKKWGRTVEKRVDLVRGALNKQTPPKLGKDGLVVC